MKVKGQELIQKQGKNLGFTKIWQGTISEAFVNVYDHKDDPSKVIVSYGGSPDALPEIVESTREKAQSDYPEIFQ